MNFLTRRETSVAKKTSSTIVDGDIIVKKSSSALTLTNEKVITLNGKKVSVSPIQLMRMIKYITQTIGEYKRNGNPLSHYVISSLRKARSDAAEDLATNFHIQMNIREDGTTEFTL